MPTINQKIREICIYHSDDGTSGFLLNEEQFEKIFDLVEGEREDFKKMIEWDKEEEKIIINGVCINDEEDFLKEIKDL